MTKPLGLWDQIMFKHILQPIIKTTEKSQETKMGFIPVILSVLVTVSSAHSEFKCDVPEDWLQEHDRNCYPGNIWSQGVVKYEFNSSLSAADIVQARIAFSEYENKTCIRFVERSPGEAAYVGTENDPTAGGVAHLCRTGRYQYAKFGGTCNRAQVKVHELGHTLCYGHEQSRKDRDDYINFPGCQSSEIHNKNENYDLAGSMYDYSSQMHYSCGRCSGGWPTMPGVTSCGDHVTVAKLSVLDVNKINNLYDCRGCLSYRFRNFQQLIPGDEEALFPGGTGPEGSHICRSYNMGDIIPECTMRRRILVLSDITVWRMSQQAGDVLSNPSSSLMTWAVRTGTVIPAHAIAGGRTTTGQTLFIGKGAFNVDDTQILHTGYVHEWSTSTLKVPFGGTELSTSSFEFLVCNE